MTITELLNARQHQVLQEMRTNAVLLRGTLDRLISEIDERGPNAVIQNSGVVRDQGPAIDRLCIEVGLIRSLKQAIQENR